MRSTHFLVAGASVVVASTNPALNNLIEKRDTQECVSVAQDMLPGLRDVPTPSEDLATFIASQTQFATITDPCLIPAVTGSLADEYTSWASSLESWYSEKADDFSSLIDACKDVTEIQSQLQSASSLAAICPTLKWEGAAATATGTAATTASNTATGVDRPANTPGSNSDDNDDDSDQVIDSAANGASIKTGLAVVAAAVAGVFAVAL